MTVAAVNASNTWNVNSCIDRAAAVSSIRPIVSATDVFLMRFIVSRRERRHDDPERHRQQHVAIRLRQREAERGAGHALAARQRLDAGAHLLGDARRGEQPEPEHRGNERRPRRVICLIEFPSDAGQQLGQHEEPEEQLDQQRNVAEELDVGVAEAHRPLDRRGAHDADDRTEDEAR